MTVFLPCRAGSQRIPKKNTKPFAGVQGGLLTVKLRTLLKVRSIDKIVVSTNDPEVMEVARNMNSDKIQIDIRPDHLATSEASTDDVVKYVATIIEDEDILWTHVTSPFISAASLEKAIALYKNNTEHDSLMTVNKIQTFLWDDNGPINYDRNIEKWPRTQTLPKVFEINSGFFINSRSNYIKFEDRIGETPYLFITEGNESLDIDWPKDFDLAEMIYQHKQLT